MLSVSSEFGCSSWVARASIKFKTVYSRVHVRVRPVDGRSAIRDRSGARARTCTHVIVMALYIYKLYIYIAMRYRAAYRYAVRMSARPASCPYAHAYIYPRLALWHSPGSRLYNTRP